MSGRLLAVVVVGCSSAPVAVSVPLPPSPPVAQAPMYVPPPLVAPPPFHVECHPFTPAAPNVGARRGKVYDFAPIVLAPLRRGPLIASRPRRSFGRAGRELRAMFAGRATEITECWKVASSRGAAPTTLEVGVVIDPLGGTHDLTVQSARAKDDPLAACVKTALANTTFPGTASQAIHLGATLELVRADQPAWAQPWPAHAPGPAVDHRSGTACTPVLDDGVVPQIRLPTPLVVNDWDSSRDPPRRSAVPQIRMGCTVSINETDKRAIRTAIRSNLGEFRGCYADAFARDPALAGDIVLQTQFSRSGAAANPRMTSGVGDAQLHACMVAALQELWVTPAPAGDSSLEVNLTFTLQPPTPPPPAPDDPAALLAAGDAEGALAAWTAKLRTPVSAALACTGRAGVLLAIAELTPWLDDPRMRAAILDLANAANALSPEAARSCVAPVEPTIAELTRARGSPPGAWMLDHVWLDRYAAALPLAPNLDDGPALRWFYALALRNTLRAGEAQAILEKLAWDPAIGARVADELKKHAERTEMISDTCAD